MHEQYMRRALEFAARGRGLTSPNPLVGAVIVSPRGEVVGEGWHRRAGEAHAEINALREAGTLAAGAELYVTLEPCAHFGKTPPCTEAIISAGIKVVRAAMIDPNPLVNGAGITALTRAGIRVEIGILEREARRLNEAYCKQITAGMPFVHLKMAISLDGRIATRNGDARWISGQESRHKVHELRAGADGVMVGVGTVLADDPLLTSREGGGGGRQPRRIVIDSRLRTPLEAQVVTGAGLVETTLICGADADKGRRTALAAAGVEILAMPEPGQVHLRQALELLGARGLQSILLEGGRDLFTAMVEARLVDRVTAFVAPILIGGKDAPTALAGTGAGSLAEACRLTEVEIVRLGDDVMITGLVDNR